MSLPLVWLAQQSVLAEPIADFGPRTIGYESETEIIANNSR